MMWQMRIYYLHVRIHPSGCWSQHVSTHPKNIGQCGLPPNFKGWKNIETIKQLFKIQVARLPLPEMNYCHLPPCQWGIPTFGHFFRNKWRSLNLCWLRTKSRENQLISLDMFWCSQRNACIIFAISGCQHRPWNLILQQQLHDLRRVAVCCEHQRCHAVAIWAVFNMAKVARPTKASYASWEGSTNG